MANQHNHNDKNNNHSDHKHGLFGHSHSHGATASYKVLIIAIIIIFVYAAVEAISGWWANSLALLGDAGHMASDALTLIIAAFAAWMAKKPPSAKHSYGFGRAEVIAAWISSLILIIISVAIIVEAIERIHEPEHVAGKTVAIVAFFGLLINGFVAWLLARGERTINIRAALLHVLGDVLGSASALIAGIVIVKTGWYPIDPILSILIGVLILISSFRILRESLLILMEAVPGNIDIEEVSLKVNKMEGIKAVHDLHIWTLSSGIIAMSAHVRIQDLTGWQNILEKLKTMLKENYNIGHVTLQPEPEIFECEPCQEPNQLK